MSDQGSGIDPAAETIHPIHPGIGRVMPTMEEREIVALESIVGCLRRIATALEKDESLLSKLFGKR